MGSKKCQASKRRVILPLFLSFFLLFIIGETRVTSASRVDELKQQIGDQITEIEKIDQEIAEYEVKIDEKEKEATTLNNEISRINTSINRISANIRKTDSEIEKTQLELEKTLIEIGAKEQEINAGIKSLAGILREMNEVESQSLVEILLAHNSLSDFFNNLKYIEDLDENIRVRLNELRSVKWNLEIKEVDYRNEKKELSELQNELEDRRVVERSANNDKKYLLTITKNKEAEYQKLLKERKVKKEAFESEIRDLESELRLVIDPDSIPPVGSGVLYWPLDNIKITQYFGNTPFATKNAQIYNGAGHTGVDLRASSGTKVKAALGGTVEGLGDTDSVRGCYSYGKWILIKHKNGLSTLYAHLSLISINVGESVETGQTIGYSGNTGYSTGPHLHFTVYATQGVKITKFENSINCKDTSIPIADKKAYLNPLSYL